METEKGVTKKSFTAEIGKAGFKACFILAFCLAIARGYDFVVEWGKIQYAQAKETIVDKITIKKVITEYKPPDEGSLREIVNNVSKEMGIDPLIMQVIAIKESSHGKALYRFEKRKFSQLIADPKYKGVSEDEVRMISSSHGAFHVMGYTAQGFCKMHWSRLYNTYEAARCATAYAKHCWDANASIKSAEDRFWATFKSYNGEGPEAEAYANDAMSKLAGILYSQLEGGK